MEGLGHALIKEEALFALLNRLFHRLIKGGIVEQFAGDGDVIVGVAGDQLREFQHLEHRHGVAAAHEGCGQGHHRAVERKGLHGAVASVPIDGVDRVVANRK